MNRGPNLKRNGRLAGFILFIFALLGIIAAPQTTTASYIVQGESLETAVTAVERVGGAITHELSIINSVGANLTPAQLSHLQANPAISSVQENRSLQTSIETIETVEVRVNSSADDAEERSDGDMYLDSSDLELVYDGGNQMVGMRFRDLQIPQGAIITNATVEFETDETNDSLTSLLIQAEAVDDAAAFTSSDNNISSRPRTVTAVNWLNIPAWNSTSEKHQSPNISTVIQEVVSRSGWNSGNDLVLIITGTGERTAESYDGESSNAPLLHIEYALGEVVPSPETEIVKTVRDEFNSSSFSNNDGSDIWATDWIEINESNGPSTGEIEVEDKNVCFDNDCLIVGSR